MNERSKSVAVVAGLLFAVYTLGWFVEWLLRHHGNRQEAVGIGEIVLIAVVIAVAMFRWARLPMIEAMPRLVLAVSISCVATALISPFAGGSYPFAAGAGDFFLKIWIFLGASLVGMVLGYIVVVAVGRDYRTGALRRMEQARPATTKPRSGNPQTGAKSKQKAPRAGSKTGPSRR